ncbi:hypothetical protein BH11PLA2_BH11PLA2_33950 [soil metagenome]
MEGAETPETAVFASPSETPLDLKFRWFGFPTRIHPLFWLITLLLGPLDLRGPYALEAMGIWIVCVFISILMHELGHALAYRFYRCGDVKIELYGMGGLAIAQQQPRGHYRRIAVYLAGPGIQFVIAFLLWISLKIDPFWPIVNWPPYLMIAYFDLYSINLGWAIFNLLPIYPLDGGQVCREICFLKKVPRALEVSLKVSIATAIGLICLRGVAEVQPALISWLPSWFPIPGCLFTILLLASLAYSSYQALQLVQADPWGHNEDEREPWES